MKDIFLTGPKHSGKTSAGKILASLCSCEFIDTDNLIYKNTGKSPRTLFCEDVTIFKNAETQALSYITGSSSELPRIIATGGGVIDNPNAVSVLKEANALAIYLNISADNAWDRIVKSSCKELPPFLKTEDPRKTHRNLHEKRAALYLQIADIVIEAEEKSPEEIAKEIFEQIDLKNN
jgi:shikimate kinase